MVIIKKELHKSLWVEEVCAASHLARAGETRGRSPDGGSEVLGFPAAELPSRGCRRLGNDSRVSQGIHLN